MINKISAFVQLVSGHNLSYNEALKAAFHKQGKVILKEIAERMELTNYEVRSNLGGIAVSGEVTLHGEHIYVQFSQTLSELGFMYRKCNGHKDYAGESNHWMQWNKLENLDEVVKEFKRVSEPKFQII